MDERKPKKLMSDMVARPKPQAKPEAVRPEPARPKPLSVPVPARAVPEPVYAEPVPSLKPRKEQQGHSLFLWVTAAVCALALVLGIGGIFAHAKVSVVPANFSGEANATLQLSRQGAPGTIFVASAMKTYSEEVIVPAIGRNETESRATGKIVLYNSGVSAKTIPAGTVLLSPKSVAYQTAKSVTVPAQKKAGPGRAETSVIAVEAGSRGNAGPDDLAFEEKEEFSAITARMPEAATGGAGGNDAVADPEAVAAATEQVRQRFADASPYVARLSEGVPDAMMVLPVSVGPSTLSIETLHDRAEGVVVRGEQSVGILMVKKAELARALGGMLGAGADVPLTVKSVANATFLTSAALSAAAMPEQLSLRVTGPVELVADIPAILSNIGSPKKLAGMKKKDVLGLLKAQPGVSGASVSMRPFWRRVMPADADDISVVIP